MSYLSSIKGVARGQVEKPVSTPNATLNVGIFEENTASLPQTKFIKGIKEKKPSVNDDVSTSFNTETGKGKIYVPDTKEYYTGEVL